MQPPFSLKICAVLVAAGLSSLSSRCFADPIAISSSAVTAPLSDGSLSLNTGSINSNDSYSGPTTFQTGDFILGNPYTSSQIIPFSFLDTITLNGVTEILDIFGQDDITRTSDTLTIFAGTPIVFGNDYFTLQSFSTTGNANGGEVPVDLQATVVPTSEPSSLLLLGTGIIAVIVLLVLVDRPLEPPAGLMEATANLTRQAALNRSWVQRGAAFHPSSPEAASPDRYSGPPDAPPTAP